MSSGYAVAEEAQIPSSLLKKQKVKKTGFIKRWLLNSVKEAVDQEREANEMNSIKLPRGLAIGTGPTLDSNRGIRFQVYKATGGFVVETSMYDQRTDRHSNSIHIITDEQDLGQQIGKIITMETLKQ